MVELYLLLSIVCETVHRESLRLRSRHLLVCDSTSGRRDQLARERELRIGCLRGLDKLGHILTAPLIDLAGVLILYLRKVQAILVILRDEHGVLVHLWSASRSHVLVDV